MFAFQTLSKHDRLNVINRYFVETRSSSSYKHTHAHTNTRARAFIIRKRVKESERKKESNESPTRDHITVVVVVVVLLKRYKMKRSCINVYMCTKSKTYTHTHTQTHTKKLRYTYALSYTHPTCEFVCLRQCICVYVYCMYMCELLRYVLAAASETKSNKNKIKYTFIVHIRFQQARQSPIHKRSIGGKERKQQQQHMRNRFLISMK